MINNPIVVNISQYISVSNHYIVHLKLTVLHLSYISRKLGGGEKSDLREAVWEEMSFLFPAEHKTRSFIGFS